MQKVLRPTDRAALIALFVCDNAPPLAMDTPHVPEHHS